MPLMNVCPVYAIIYVIGPWCRLYILSIDDVCYIWNLPLQPIIVVQSLHNACCSMLSIHDTCTTWSWSVMHGHNAGIRYRVCFGTTDVISHNMYQPESVLQSVESLTFVWFWQHICMYGKAVLPISTWYHIDQTIPTISVVIMMVTHVFD
jgi:hypothetical protein